MSGARDHQGQHDERSPAGVARRAPDPDHAPAIADRNDPRLSHGGAEAGLMHLQRTAGNAAVASMVAPAVQRAVEIDEITSDVDAPALEPGGGASTGPVTSDGGTTTISGSAIRLDAAMTSTDGIIRANTIIADNVVGSNYTPGAGNIW